MKAKTDFRLTSGGQRACDSNGCWRPWPCDVHGTLTSATVAGVVIRLQEYTACKGCGYLKCSCKPEPAPSAPVQPQGREVPEREGWTLHGQCTSGKIRLPCYERDGWHVFRERYGLGESHHSHVARRNFDDARDPTRIILPSLEAAQLHVERELAAATEPKPGAGGELPSGWVIDSADPGCEYFGPYHVHGPGHGDARVFLRKRDDLWLAEPGCTSHPSMLQAMARALGLVVERLEHSDGYICRAPGSEEATGIYRTADAAALAALKALG